jgi:osmotically-inducible protein OsmY
MEEYNKNQRYRNDNRSSSDDRNSDNRWDRTYNRSDDWGGYNNENRDVYSSDRERDYWNEGNQMNRNYYTNRDNYNSDYNRNSNSDYNNRRNNFRDNDYNSGNDYMRNDRNRDYNNRYRNDNSERYRNEGWRDNYRNEDRNWWDKTKDEVGSWFGDDDAKRRRRIDEINDGQHRGKGPKNYTRSQERIKEDVSDKLSDDSFLDASEIEVEVNGNEVTLSGSVDSRYSKHRAEDIAEDVTGVNYVQNNLRVNENTQYMNTNSAETNTNRRTTTGSTYNTTKNRKEHVTL